MAVNHIQTIEKIVPHRLAQVFLRIAMEASFPEHRECIQQHLTTFASVFNRYSYTPLNTRSLQNYFLNECGWTEFRAAWYRTQIDKALTPAVSRQKKQ